MKRALMIELCANNDNREKRLDLVPLLSTPSWQFDQNNVWRLPGAHGEEVVRSVYLDNQVCFLFLILYHYYYPFDTDNNSPIRYSHAEKTGLSAPGNPTKREISWLQKSPPRILHRVLLERKERSRRRGKRDSSRTDSGDFPFFPVG